MKHSFLLIIVTICFGCWLCYVIGFNKGYEDGNKSADKWFSEALNQPDVALDRYLIDTDIFPPSKLITMPVRIKDKIYFPPGSYSPICDDLLDPLCWKENKGMFQ